MVRAQVAILTDPVCIVGPLCMWTFVGQFLTATWMVTIFTHTLSVESHTGMRTLCNMPFLFYLITLLPLTDSLAQSRHLGLGMDLGMARCFYTVRSLWFDDLLCRKWYRETWWPAILCLWLHILKLVINGSFLSLLLRMLQRRRLQVWWNRCLEHRGEQLLILCAPLYDWNFMALTFCLQQ